MFFRFLDCNGELEFSALLDQKAWVFGFLIEDNDTFNFLSIQSQVLLLKDVLFSI